MESTVTDRIEAPRTAPIPALQSAGPPDIVETLALRRGVPAKGRLGFLRAGLGQALAYFAAIGVVFTLNLQTGLGLGRAVIVTMVSAVVFGPLLARILRFIGVEDKGSTAARRDDLRDIAATAAATLELDEIHRMVVRKICRVYRAEGSALYVKEAGAGWRCAAMGRTVPADFRLLINDPIEDDLDDAVRSRLVCELDDGVLAIPILVDDRTHVVLLIEPGEHGLFTDDDYIGLAELADELAIAMRNARAHRTLQRLTTELNKVAKDAEALQTRILASQTGRGNAGQGHKDKGKAATTSRTAKTKTHKTTLSLAPKSSLKSTQTPSPTQKEKTAVSTSPANSRKIIPPKMATSLDSGEDLVIDLTESAKSSGLSRRQDAKRKKMLAQQLTQAFRDLNRARLAKTLAEDSSPANKSAKRDGASKSGKSQVMFVVRRGKGSSNN